MHKFIYLLCLSVICLFHGCKESVNNSNTNFQGTITWSQHIAPIIFKNCTPCHRPNQSGPFNLLNYADAVLKSKLIKFVTQTRYMPPWPADAEYTHFIGERQLDTLEIRLIKLWVDNGCLRGDSAKEPVPMNYNDISFFGKPDLVLKPKEVFTIQGNGTDVFLIMKFPFELEHDTIADLIEFVPHQKKIVHHVNGHLLSYDENRKFNYLTGSTIENDERAQLLDIYAKMHIPYTDPLTPKFPTLTPNTVYYLPGYLPPHYPKEIGGYKLKKHGAFLLNNIHFGPSNKTLIDSSYINVFFRKDPIKRPITEAQMGTFGISKVEPEFIIPPNEIKTFSTSAKIEKTISLLSVNPHMHLIGKSFLAYAVKPSGDTIPLIKINKWDFKWQYYYTYKHPLKIEAGSVIYAFGTFDNTFSNPFNPNNPPKSITNGNGVESMKTTEEMFQFIFTYIPYQPGDELIDLERKD